MIIKSTAEGLGDCISSTPALRKISKIFNTKIEIYSYYPDIFKTLPYIKYSHFHKVV